MSVKQLKSLLNSINQQDKKNIIIRVESNNTKKGIERSKALIANLERQMRIQKLELAIKKLNINRSWV